MREVRERDGVSAGVLVCKFNEPKRAHSANNINILHFPFISANAKSNLC